MIYKRSYIKRNWKNENYPLCRPASGFEDDLRSVKGAGKREKMEILRTYSRMIEYAKNNDVKAIIIAGDLFDTRNVSATARNLVKDLITSNPDIDFYYLKGNHDSDNFISKLDEIPENLKLFLVSGPHTAMEISQ